MTIEVAQRRWLRSERLCRTFAVLWVLLGLFWVGLYVGTAISEGPAPLDVEVVLIGFNGTMAAACFVIAVRFLRGGLWLDQEDVIVRGPLRTRRFATSDVRQFGPMVVSGAGNGTPCVTVHLNDDRTVGVFVLGRQGWVWHFDRDLKELQPLCDSLNKLLASLQAPAADPTAAIAP